MRSVTAVVILLLILSTILYDLLMWACYDEATISEVIGEYLTTETNPSLVFFLGFGLGMLVNHFVGWKPDSKWKRV